jgi:hypothetical protein
MPDFSPEDLQTLATTHEVDIQPRRKNGELARRKIIWIVVDNGQPYVRSVRGTSGAWYKAALATSSALIHAGSTTWPVNLTLVTDAAEISRVSDALSQKYAKRWQSSTAAMLRDEVLSATLRVTLAEPSD